MDKLIGAHAANMIPLKTIGSSLNHNMPEGSVDQTLGRARAALGRQDALPIDLDEITDAMLVEGVQSFTNDNEKPIDSLVENSAEAQPA